jgi:DNA repair protein RecO (recombination protein O)
MKLEDEGIVLSCTKFGDSSLVLKVFSKNHGVIGGMVRGQKKNMALAQAGNLIKFFWNARLEEHLGAMQMEAVKLYPAMYFGDYSKVLMVNSITSMLKNLLPEKECYYDLYENLLVLFESLNGDDWLKNYALFELEILSKIGFGLDLTSCAATGQTDNLFYISPKSGAAVSFEAGKPYKDRLFTLPKFFRNDYNPTHYEIVEAIEVTRYFISKNLKSSFGKNLPVECEFFTEHLKKSCQNQPQDTVAEKHQN